MLSQLSVRHGGAIWRQREGWWPTITTDHRPRRFFLPSPLGMDGINHQLGGSYHVHHIKKKKTRSKKRRIVRIHGWLWKYKILITTSDFEIQGVWKWGIPENMIDHRVHHAGDLQPDQIWVVPHKLIGKSPCSEVEWKICSWNFQEFHGESQMCPVIVSLKSSHWASDPSGCFLSHSLCLNGWPGTPSQLLIWAVQFTLCHPFLLRMGFLMSNKALGITA